MPLASLTVGCYMERTMVKGMACIKPIEAMMTRFCWARVHVCSLMVIGSHSQTRWECTLSHLVIERQVRQPLHETRPGPLRHPYSQLACTWSSVRFKSSEGQSLAMSKRNTKATCQGDQAIFHATCYPVSWPPGPELQQGGAEAD